VAAVLRVCKEEISNDAAPYPGRHLFYFWRTYFPPVLEMFLSHKNVLCTFLSCIHAMFRSSHISSCGTCQFTGFSGLWNFEEIYSLWNFIYSFSILWLYWTDIPFGCASCFCILFLSFILCSCWICWSLQCLQLLSNCLNGIHCRPFLLGVGNLYHWCCFWLQVKPISRW